MELPKIKSIKTYQPYTFNKSVESHFTINQISGKQKIEYIVFHPELSHYEVKGEFDHIFIPISNVIGMTVLKQSDIDAAEALRAEQARGNTPAVIKKLRN